jgi:hypothetical protein
VKQGSFEHVRQDPDDCCAWLITSGAVSGIGICTSAHTEGVTIFDATMSAPAELADYPIELARVSVFANRLVATVPIGQPTRLWQHRYDGWPISRVMTQDPNGLWPWPMIVGGLCLEYPRDPWCLRWSWDRGFDTYLQLVQRHFFLEEFYRRHHDWPVEAAPHGERPDGKPHPITTPLLRSA